MKCFKDTVNRECAHPNLVRGLLARGLLMGLFFKILQHLLLSGLWYQFQFQSDSITPTRLQPFVSYALSSTNRCSYGHADYTQQLSSSSKGVDGHYKCSISGVLVRDPNGQVLITAAAHTFNADGLVYHPTPGDGPPIGRVIHQYPLLDLALVKLNRGICYINECFHTESETAGPVITGLLPSANTPSFNVYTSVYMDNPFSGRCQGMTTGFGVTVESFPGISHIPIVWLTFNGVSEVQEGSCGSVIWEELGHAIGFYPFESRSANSSTSYAVSTKHLVEKGYSPVHGQYIFQ
jgi:hypothetical protein